MLPMVWTVVSTRLLLGNLVVGPHTHTACGCGAGLTLGYLALCFSGLGLVVCGEEAAASNVRQATADCQGSKYNQRRSFISAPTGILACACLCAIRELCQQAHRCAFMQTNAV